MNRQLGYALFLSIFGITFITACNPAEVNRLRAQVDSLRGEVESATKSKEENDLEMRELERQTSKMKTQLESAQKDRDRLEEALKKLDKDFTDYREKYKAAIAKKLPGLPIGSIIYDKRTYNEVAVRSIENDTLVVSHPNGILHVKAADLTPAQAAFLGVDPPGELQLQTRQLLSEISDHRMEERGIAKNIVKPLKATTMAPSRIRAFDEEVAKFVCVITMFDGRGGASGFIARQGNNTYFYTNVHVVEKGGDPHVRTTDGREFSLPDDLDMADEDDAYDLVRFLLGGKGVPGLELLDDNSSLGEGDKVVAMGNSGGAGVVPVLEGKIKAVGPHWVETDAQVVKGNSGGPLLLDGTSKVIGVVTRYDIASGHSEDPGYSGTSFNGIRRMCIRPEKIQKWRHTSMSRLAAEPKILEKIALESRYLQGVLNTRFSDKGIFGAGETVMSSGVRSEMAEAIAAQVRSANAVLQRGGARLAKPAVVDVCQQFINCVTRVYGQSVAGVDESSFSRPNRAKFHQLAAERRDICNNIIQHLNAQMTSMNPYSPR